MRDEDLDRELSALLDGELTPERARQLRDEIDADPALRARLAEFESLDENLRALPQAPLPAELGAQLRARIEQRGRNGAAEATAGPSAGIPRWGVPLAAALAAGLVAAWLMWPASDSHESDRQATLQAREQPQPRAREQVQLLEQRQEQRQPEQHARNQPNPGRSRIVQPEQPSAEPDDSSDEEIAIALELETLRDLDLIQELDLLEALLTLKTSEQGSG